MLMNEMLMCPAAFLFATTADNDPDLGPVGPYLQQNDCSNISMQILLEEKKQNINTHTHKQIKSFADWLWKSSSSSEAQRDKN